MKLFLAILVLLFLGCDSKSSSPITPEGEAALAFKIANSDIECDSIQVLLSKSGAIAYSKTMAWEGAEDQYLLDDTPWGDSIEIELNLFNDLGKVLYVGLAITDIELGGLTTVSVMLQSMFAKVYIEIPVGLENVQDIVGGGLSITNSERSYSVPLEGSAPVKHFAIPLVDFGDDYVVNLYLWDSGGDTLYMYNSVIDITNETATNLAFSLQSLISQLQLDITFSEMIEVSGVAIFPKAQLKNAREFHDVMITELSPYPRSGGDDYEWIELYNTGMDTVNLKGCALKKTITSSTATTRVEIEEDLFIDPSAFLVLGRDSVDFADFNYSSFILSNSGQSIYIMCDTLMIDSLIYKSASDSINPFPIESGYSLDIEVAHIRERENGMHWCSGSDSIEFSTGLENFGSPHSFGICPSE